MHLVVSMSANPFGMSSLIQFQPLLVPSSPRKLKKTEYVNHVLVCCGCFWLFIG